MFKLIRDGIPELIQQSGKVCNYAEVKNREFFIELLRAKFVEEINEFFTSGDVEELADVILVAETFAEVLGQTREQFKELCENKIATRGRFDNKYIIFLPDQPKSNISASTPVKPTEEAQ
jgi:predicted house-cleaning noncanonical NTP pyrophosphatase (MazG superfamily)